MWRSRRVNGGLAYCDLLMQGQSISNSAHCQVTHLLLYNSACLKLAYPKRKIEKLRRIVSCRARHNAVPSCSSHPIVSFNGNALGLSYSNSIISSFFFP
jgi:hypothetical protein